MLTTPYTPKPIEIARKTIEGQIRHITAADVTIGVRADVLAGMLAACDELDRLRALSNSPEPDDHATRTLPMERPDEAPAS